MVTGAGGGGGGGDGEGDGDGEGEGDGDGDGEGEGEPAPRRCLEMLAFVLASMAARNRTTAADQSPRGCPPITVYVISKIEPEQELARRV
jgi:hypothetical protein